MAEQMTPAEGGGAIAVVLLLLGSIAHHARMDARVERARVAAEAAEARAAAVELELAAAIETLEERYVEALRRARSDSFSSSPRISRSSLVEDVVKEIVRGHLRELEMRIDALTERVGDVVRLVRLLTGAEQAGAPPPPPSTRGRRA